MNALLKAILDNSTVPALVADSSEHLLAQSLPFQRLTGFSLEDILDKPLSHLFEKDDCAGGDKDGEKNPPYNYQLSALKTSGGRSLPVHVEKVPLQMNGDDLNLLFIFDCSELDNLLTDRIHQERLVSLGKLLTGIIHEISNPLTIINGCAQMLAAKKLPPEIEEDIGRIYAESKRTSDLLRTLLSFGRKKSDSRELLCIQNVVDEATTLKKYSLKSNNISLQYVHSPRPPLMVWGDRVQLMQVLINLINNAEQAILESKGKGSIGVDLAQKDAHVDLKITDTGPGIDSQDQDQIFDAFFTTKSENRGTGMGLYISHNIIQQHGGKLRLMESGSGNTQFQIRLPLKKGEEITDNRMEGAGSV